MRFKKLAEKLGAPVVTTILAKGVFPMDHPQHMGIHVGTFSAKEINQRVREADLVLAFGTQLTDLNLGATKSQVERDRSVWATSNRVNVSFHSYTDVMLKNFVEGLVAQRLPKIREKITYYDNLKRGERSAKKKLSINDMLVEVNDFLSEHGGYDVFAESGDMLFGGLEVRPQKGGLYYAQGYYASMGFGIPAALGVQIGTGRRPLILCGDGGFQMTGLGDLPCATPRSFADRGPRQQRRLGDLPPGDAEAGAARPAAVALCQTRRILGWRWYPRDDPR